MYDTKALLTIPSTLLLWLLKATFALFLYLPPKVAYNIHINSLKKCLHGATNESFKVIVVEQLQNEFLGGVMSNSNFEELPSCNFPHIYLFERTSWVVVIKLCMWK